MVASWAALVTPAWCSCRANCAWVVVAAIDCATRLVSVWAHEAARSKQQVARRIFNTEGTENAEPEEFPDKLPVKFSVLSGFSVVKYGVIWACKAAQRL